MLPLCPHASPRKGVTLPRPRPRGCLELLPPGAGSVKCCVGKQRVRHGSSRQHFTPAPSIRGLGPACICRHTEAHTEPLAPSFVRAGTQINLALRLLCGLNASHAPTSTVRNGATPQAPTATAPQFPGWWNTTCLRRGGAGQGDEATLRWRQEPERLRAQDVGCAAG